MKISAVTVGYADHGVDETKSIGHFLHGVDMTRLLKVIYMKMYIIANGVNITVDTFVAINMKKMCKELPRELENFRAKIES